MKAIGLIRVSTLVQDLQQQAEVVKNEMIKDGYIDDPEHIILIQDQESATKLSEEERHGLNEMKSFIENDPDINRVYVFELSRLSRRPEVLYSIRDWLISHHVNLIVLKPYMKLFEDDGTVSPAGSIMFGIFGAMSEQEGYIRKERFKRGKMKAQLEGKSLGNWLPLGYTTDSERHIIIDNEKAELVKKIFHMCVIENKSTTIIARELTESGEFPTQSTIRGHSSSILNILRNSAYIGKAPFNKKDNKVNYNQYPRIIDDVLFEQAQELLSNRKKLPKTGHKNIYFCKGLLKDKNSGHVLRAASAVASYGYCSDRSDPIKYKSISVPINLFDSFAWHLTQEFLKKTDTKKIKDAKKDIQKRMNELKTKGDVIDKRVEEIMTRIERIQKRIVMGKINETLGDRMIDEAYAEYDDIKLRNAEFSREYHLLSYKLHKYESGELTEEEIISATDQDKYNLIHDVIKEIIVEKGGDRLEPGRKRKRGLGIKYGIMEVHYDSGLVEQYKFNSYTRKCFTMNDVEVPFEHVLRIKGQQHQPGYQIKNKKWRDEHRNKL